jgi:hypothetical protein
MDCTHCSGQHAEFLLDTPDYETCAWVGYVQVSMRGCRDLLSKYRTVWNEALEVSGKRMMCKDDGAISRLSLKFHCRGKQNE